MFELNEAQKGYMRAGTELGRKMGFDKPAKAVAVSYLEGIAEDLDAGKMDAERVACALQIALRHLTAEPSPKAAAGKDPLKWAMQAAARCEYRPDLRGVYCDEGRYIATDGRRLHMVCRPAECEHVDGDFIRLDGVRFSAADFEAGAHVDKVYAAKRENRGVPVTFGKFPDYKRVVPAWTGDKVTAGPRIVPNELHNWLIALELPPGGYCQGADMHVSERFYKEAALRCTGETTAHDELSPLVMVGQDCKAVIMPVRA